MNLLKHLLLLTFFISLINTPTFGQIKETPEIIAIKNLTKEGIFKQGNIVYFYDTDVNNEHFKLIKKKAKLQ